MKINENASIKIPSKLIVPILTFALGAVFFFVGLDYGFWDSAAAKPTKGFFPTIMSVALMIISVLGIINGIKAEKVEFKLYNWFVPLGLVAVIAASYVIGLVPAILIFEFVWLRLYEKVSWKATIITLAIVVFIVVCCFQLWLGIDFPVGLIGNLIFG